MAKFLSLVHPLVTDLSAVSYPSQCDIDFSDLSEVDASLSLSVLDVCRIGLMRGSDRLFRPKDYLSRYEFLVAIDRLGADRSQMRSLSGPYITRAEALEALYMIADSYHSHDSTGELDGVWQLESTTLSGADISQARSRLVTFSGSSFSHQICNSTSGTYSLQGSRIHTQ